MNIKDSDIIIRLANIKDINGLEKCNKNNLPIYYTSREYLDYIKTKDVTIIIAEHYEKIIGYIFGKLSYDNIHIMSIGVDQPFRSNGVGSGLLSYLMIINKDKFKTISLYVHTENSVAINFYKKNDFKIVKKLDNYYWGTFDNNKCDAYKMVYTK